MSASLNKLLHFPIVKIIIGVAFCFTMLVVIKNFAVKPFLYAVIPDRVTADTIKNYISSTIMVFSYFFLFRFYERREITELSIKKIPKEFAGGLALGFSMISLAILILFLLGYYKAFSISNSSYMLEPFSFLFTAAVFEEVFYRLIVYRVIEEWLGTWWALVLMTVVFATPHFFNPNISPLAVLAMLVFSITTGVIYTYSKSLWLPFAFHLGWNFAQPFYGSNLSGLEDIGSIIKSKFTGPEWLTGSKFGIEDSILSILFLAGLSVILLYVCFKKGKIRPYGVNK